MRSLWRQKWLVVIGALTIFLSIGAAAWAVGSDDASSGSEVAAATCATCSDEVQGAGERPGEAMRQAMKERRQERLERQAALLDALRDDMSPEDQALYDQLVASAKQKREALQQAREDLADTLKELRELTDKYLDIDGTGTSG